MKPYLLRLVACLFLCVSLNSFGGSFTLTSFNGLGNLPGANDSTFIPWDLSADGSIIVGDGLGVNGWEGFKYQNGVFSGLGSFGHSSSAYAISGDGSTIVGHSSYDSGEPWPYDSGNVEAYKFINGEMIGLGHSSEWDQNTSSFHKKYSSARDVSFDGTIIIGTSNNPLNEIQSFIISGGNMVEVEGPESKLELASITPDGYVSAGTSYASNYEPKGVIYLSESVYLLGSGSEAWVESNAFAISADGSVIVGNGKRNFTDDYSASGGFEGFIFRDGLFTPLGLVTSASSVSGDGSILVGSSGSNSAATIWDSVTLEMMDLQELLLESGIDINNEGFSKLNVATAISDDGSTIVGYGTKNGVWEGFKAEINYTASPVPLPAGITLFLTGLVGLGLIKRRK